MEQGPLAYPAWGKTGADGRGAHPLVHHSMDVAAVFERLLETPVVRDRLDRAAARPLTDVDRARLSALAFLHDIGKLHPGFQAKGWPPGAWKGPRRGHLEEGWAFLLLALKWPEHPFHGTIQRVAGWGAAVKPLLAAALAHHGRPVDPPPHPTLPDWDWPRPPAYDWRAEARRMDGAVESWFAGAFDAAESDLPDESRFHHLVAGLVALADWIGSNKEVFPFAGSFASDYPGRARAAAAEAVERIGLAPGARARRPAPAFADVAAFAAPNPAQAAVAEADPEARLVILEAETGSGKTEAALWRFASLYAAGRVSGLYFAVPTRAAARQLHGRVDRAAKRLFGPDEPAAEAVLAIPGMLRAGEFDGRRLPDWEVRWDDESGPVLRRWAAEHATRFLAAPVAVGTVDQAMLAGLQTKHAHMRGAALCRSLLVVDEVHASDAYMTEVLAQLLEGHLAVGGYAMLMSATLGARARSRWTGGKTPSFETARGAPYPAVWVAGETEPRAPADSGRPKTVRLETMATMDPAGAAARAVAAARRGARVLVVRNTVRAAVETWRTVRDAGAEADALLLRAGDGPALHHGRFAAEDRELLDQAVEEALKPDPNRAMGGRIVVGTQTLEQSLDIDADLLVSDLCPMDVLLQRIGRLHRHRLPRPEGFEDPRAIVLLPERGLDRLAKPDFENGLGAWERDGGVHGVYVDLAVLELTRRAIVEEPEWRIPAMNRALVEGATHPERVAALVAGKGEAWGDYNRKIGGVEAASKQFAALNALDRDKPFADLRFPPSDEHILTRLGEEGIVLTLDPPPAGPFGRPIARIALPARWSRGIGRDDRAEVETGADGLVLAVGGRRFRYTREGLQPLVGIW